VECVQSGGEWADLRGHLFGTSIDGSPVGSAGVTSVAYVR
jgi:hypothetical protein